MNIEPSIPLDASVDKGSLTASSAKIFWKVPTTPNGLIAYYTVSYVIGQYLVANSSSAVETRQVANESLNVILKNLSSCSWYTTWVQATRKEKGRRLESDTSAVATFKTLASGKHCNRIQSQGFCLKSRYVTLRYVWSMRSANRPYKASSHTIR